MFITYDSKTKHPVHRSFTIWGVGETEDASIEDAARWAENSGAEIAGVTIAATDKLILHIEDEGGDEVAWYINKLEEPHVAEYLY